MSACAGYVCAQGTRASCANARVRARVHTETDGRTWRSSSLLLKPGSSFRLSHVAWTSLSLQKPERGTFIHGFSPTSVTQPFCV